MKRLFIILAAVIVLVVAVAAGALLLVNPNRFRPQIQASLSQALGRPVTLGQLHVSLLSGSLAADRISIGDDPAFGKQPFVSARSLDVGVHLWPLIVQRRLEVTSLTLDHPVVRLIQNRAGRWNFSSFAAGGTPQKTSPSSSGVPAISVDKLRIRDGRIELKRAVGEQRTYDKVQISAEHIGATMAFPFSMSAAIAGGGNLKLDGTFGPLAAGNAVMTPLDAHLVIHDLNLVKAGLMSKGDGVGGVIAIDTRIASKAGMLHSQGRIDAHKLQLVASGSPAPQPIRVDYRADYKLASESGSISHTTVGTGKAGLSVYGSFDNRGAVMRMNLAIVGKKLPVDDLQPLLPAFGVVLPKNSRLQGGTLGVNLRARGPLDKLVISGPVTLDNSRLAGYSLGQKLGGALSLVGINAPRDTVIKHADATLNITPSGIRADPAQAQIAGVGQVTGKGRMAASGALDFDMLVKLDKAIAGNAGSSGLLSHSRAGRLLGGVLGGTSSQGVGVHVGGTASDPKFRLDKSVMLRLLRSGIGNTGAPKPSSGTAKKSSSTKDVLGNLLRNALDKKKGSSGGP